MTTASQSNTSSAPPTNAGSSSSASVPSPSTPNLKIDSHRLCRRPTGSPCSVMRAVKSSPQATAMTGVRQAQQQCRPTRKGRAASESCMAPLMRSLRSVVCGFYILFLMRFHLLRIRSNVMPGNIAVKVDSIGFHEICGPNGVRKSRKGRS